MNLASIGHILVTEGSRQAEQITHPFQLHIVFAAEAT